MSGLVASAAMLWTTFAPCFLWIFLLAPWMERARTNRVLSGALAAVTAVVVGVVLDLAAWFATHVLFRQVSVIDVSGVRVQWPVVSSFDGVALVCAGIAFVLLVRGRRPLVLVLATCAVLAFAARSSI
jgi:chromate transporter